MVGGYGLALAAGWVVARSGIAPGGILVPLAAALVIAALFSIRPAEGIGLMLLVSLLANTVQLTLTMDLRYFDEISLLLLGVVALVRYRVPRGRLRFGVAETSVGVLVVAGVLSSLANAVPVSIWVPGLALLLKGVAFFFLVSWLPLRRAEVIRVGGVLVTIAVVLLALGYVELVRRADFQAFFGLPPYYQWRGGLTVVKSLFLHPAVFGWITVYAGLFFYLAFVVVRRWWTLLIAIAMSVGTVLSARRTPLLGLFVALLAAAAWYWWNHRTGRSMRTWLPVAAAVAVITVVFLPVTAGFYGNTVNEYGDSPAVIAEIFAPQPDGAALRQLAPRTALYAASVAIARDHFPLGVGTGRFGSFLSRSDYSPVYAQYGLDEVPGLSPGNRVAIDDTFWPSVLGETGVIGLVAFLLIIGTILVRIWRAIPAEGTDRAWLLATMWAMLTFIQGIVASLTAATYVAPPIAYWVLGTAAAILGVVATEAEPRPVTPGADPAPARAATV